MAACLASFGPTQCPGSPHPGTTGGPQRVPPGPSKAPGAAPAGHARSRGGAGGAARHDGSGEVRRRSGCGLTAAVRFCRGRATRADPQHRPRRVTPGSRGEVVCRLLQVAPGMAPARGSVRSTSDLSDRMDWVVSCHSAQFVLRRSDDPESRPCQARSFLVRGSGLPGSSACGDQGQLVQVTAPPIPPSRLGRDSLRPGPHYSLAGFAKSLLRLGLRLETR
jgi:hypothetical protein